MNRHTGQWVLKAEEDIEIARTLAALPSPKRDGACFHCQQAAEKYLKALLQELGLAVPKTHDLNNLLNLLLTHDGTLAPLRRGLQALSRYAVDYRYPGIRATTRRMEAALRQAERVRQELRDRLSLPQ